MLLDFINTNFRLFSLLENSLFIVGCFFLAYFSYLDIKYRKIDNGPILVFFLSGLVFSYTNKTLLIVALLECFLFACSYYLWKKNALGGADVKILPCIIAFIGIPIMLNLSKFLFIFAIIGGIYGIIMKKIGKNEVPFIPIIALCFILTYLI